VSKIDDQNQLDNYKEKTTQHSKVHPNRAKRLFRNEESTNNPANYQEILDRPESVNFTYQSQPVTIVMMIDIIIHPFCMGARGSRELFTLIIIRDIRKKYRERIKHIL